MNFIQIIFCLLTIGIIAFGSLINYFESKLPHFLNQTFRYGKFSAKGKKSKLVTEVPKAWFKHFYLFAVLIYTYVLILVTTVYIFNWNVPNYVSSALDQICGSSRYAYTSKNKVFIAVLLMALQVYRRFYDTHFISVFGTDSKINLSHYFAGHIHYPGTALAILCEAPIFTEAPDEVTNEALQLFNLSYSELFSIVLFLYAWWHQHICTKLLAALRKNKKGNVVTNEYKLPEGDWFNYLSAPHQTAEILMYACLMWLLWHNITWFYIFTWVLSNQVNYYMLDG